MASDLLQLTTYDAPARAPLPAPPAAPDAAVPMDADREYKLHRQFDRLGRLYGDEAVRILMSTRAAVFGLGGVGSFAAEGLARSAVGRLMLVDFDEVCVTNTNRQLQALRGTVGKPKADLLRDRIRLINSEARVESARAFYNHSTSDTLLACPFDGPTDQYDVVVDCIDHVASKAHLIATAKARGILTISSMGAAGKLDPTRIRIADLADTHGDPLAREIRRILRKEYGFPQKGPMGVIAVFSDEPRAWPRALSYDKGEGFKCVCPHKNPAHMCDARQLIDGTAVFVTGAFGLALSAAVVNTLTEDARQLAPAGQSRLGHTPKESA